MKSINVVSLFNGMSCGRLALDKLGVDVSNYFSAEIKPSALLVEEHNYPQDVVNRLGDVTKIDYSKLPHIDLLIGGSPCKDLSQANSVRLGLAGEKSGLFYEYVRALKELKPTYFLLENVAMKKDQEDEISEILNCRPIKINSSTMSAQLRNRLYWTNIPLNSVVVNDIKLNDILIDGYSDRDKARALLESDSRPLSTPIKMAHRYFNTGFTTLIFKSKEHFDVIKEHFDIHFKGKSAKEIEELSRDMDLSVYDGIRYLNRTERELLQNVPVGYTSVLTENEAAGVLGDGWTVDVIATLLAGMEL